jgi:hypothetical protein
MTEMGLAGWEVWPARQHGCAADGGVMKITSANRTMHNLTA